MRYPLLDFKFLLAFLAWRYGSEEFDTQTVAKDLKTLLYGVIDDPKLEERLRPKLISNDLRRLYTMGFLRRRKVDRECVNKRGKRYNCGYKYMYQINNQGWKYLKILLKNAKSEDDLLQFLKKTMKEAIQEARIARLGFEKLMALELFENGRILDAKQILENVNEDIDRRFRGKGYRRFQTNRLLFEERVRCWMIIAELQRELVALREELEAKERQLRELKRELKRCRKE